MDSTTNNVRQAMEGSKTEFENLINEHKIGLYKIARGILKREEDIQDALQETILKAYKNIAHLRNEGFFGTWITRILINECKNILRKNKQLIYLDDNKEVNIKTLDNLNEIEIREIINSLDNDLKVVTVLYYYKDLSQKEIAGILRLPYGTVRSRLSRARLKLKELTEIK